MVATTSGTTTFTMDVDDIIEAALDPLGGEWTDGIEPDKARRELNLLLIELQNKRIPLHKIDTETVTVTTADSYTLNTDVIDVLEATLKETDSGNETLLTRQGRREFHQIPDKDQDSRPTTYTTIRGSSGVTLKLWPLAEDATSYTLELLVIKKIESITASYQKIDIPVRYYPLLVTWLRYKLTYLRQGFPTQERAEIRNDLREIQMDTFDEDRERVDMFIVPQIRRGN